ncbi:predicted protein [Thalassiosira pseudonana CCMP1335]|uniref:Uncharacterized protein n=1 Tax=Thalassiosira pseudonana TaxID=35128 RepID=B8C708_THAPS|nr:predicted protein [Thalassiosira pseudonana CCMP1335]EED90898.1 predicted protein [Thalassiosira pseudonana CCMP1335]|eukprot:scaffold934_cov191-Alexandrium_tamarense.AAC.6
MTSPSSASSNYASTRFIHKFGLHFANKLLGASQVNEGIRKSYHQLQNSDKSKPNWQGFRANWRSSVRFPWQLPHFSPQEVGLKPEECKSSAEETVLETIFVDITFDVLLFPHEVVRSGNTSLCHVLKREEFEKDSRSSSYQERNDHVAVSIAVRIGALFAVRSSKSGEKSDFGVDGNEYQYYYQQGKALSAEDIYNHCRCIDVDPDATDAFAIANLIGGSFVERDGSPFQIKGKLDDRVLIRCTSDKANETAEEERKWQLKLSYKSLDTEAMLPITIGSNQSHLGEQISRRALDMILLQTNAKNEEGNVALVSSAESRSLWMSISSDLMEAVEKLIEQPASEMGRATSASTLSAVSSKVVNPYLKKAPSSPQDEEAEQKSKPKPASKPAAKPPSRPTQDTVLYARGNKTAIAGSRRKRPKFQLGNI